MALHKSNPSKNEWFNSRHRAEHWYRDNSVYFLTARCTNQYHAFADDRAKQIFWDRFGFYTAKFDFRPHVTSLLDNHYHCLGYLKIGSNLGSMMRGLHGSVAKLVNDILPFRQVPFWTSYFDGCLRDTDQYCHAYHYTRIQSERHKIVPDWRNYSHTRISCELDSGLKFASQNGVFLPDIPYARYAQK